jgi:hypothetical protein
MQRAVLDRRAAARNDKTGLSESKNFGLEWMCEETQFGGHGPPGGAENALKAQ